jgi:hypothetical protein
MTGDPDQTYRFELRRERLWVLATGFELVFERLVFVQHPKKIFIKTLAQRLEIQHVFKLIKSKTLFFCHGDWC